MDFSKSRGKHSRVVLDGTDAGHLHGGLNRTSKEQSTEGRLVGEQLSVGLGFVLVFKATREAWVSKRSCVNVANDPRYCVLNLVELRSHPGVVFVSMGMKLRKRPQAFLGLAMIDEPAGVR
jgi:hypothetical protein